MNVNYKKRNNISKIDERSKKRKKAIPKALRQQVWLHYFGKKFERSCYIGWCKNRISVFNFHVGHDIPESQGGGLEISNLKPICAQCNTSMGDRYTIKQWYEMGMEPGCFSCCVIC